MPNAIASLALLSWPFVAIYLFHRLPPARALIWTLLGAYLLLPPAPAAFDFPLMPALGKNTLPNLSVLLICLFMLPRRIPLLPDSPVARFLACLFILTPIATVLTNRDPIEFVAAGLPGLRVVEAAAQVINQAILLCGFLAARPLLRTVEAQRDLLIALVIGGLAYSIPMLIEVRLSPQLNLWVYGYYQHLFEQSIRAGGFRPTVFLFHGIWAAFFTLMTVVAAMALWKVDGLKRWKRYLFATVYLGTVLLLCKTLAPMVFLVFLTPMLWLIPTKGQLQVAALLAALTVAYPILKGAHLVPSDFLLSQASKVSAERAHSLKFRFDNEDALLARAQEKPLFGWGSWGRNHLHNPIDGTITSVTDGRWIITIGVYGWFGYIAEFGLLALPLFLLWRETSYVRGRELSPYIGVLSLLLGVNMVDMLPNATLTPMTWLLSGALLGHAERLRRIRLESRDNIEVDGFEIKMKPPIQSIL